MRKIKLPPLGLRIAKSAIAVMICFIIDVLRGQENGAFFSAIAAVFCMQQYGSTAVQMGILRGTGTLLGGLFGLVVILFRTYVFGANEYLMYLFSAIMIMPLIYTTVLLNKKETAYFSCVVFLSVAIVNMEITDPYLYVINRLTGTFIGIFVGITISYFRFPKKRDKNTLYVIGLDDVLIDENQSINSFSQVELNRMLEKGLNFTVMSQGTSASVLPTLSGIRIKLPVILMDGAALYDISCNEYLTTIALSSDDVKQVIDVINAMDVNCFIHQLKEHTLLTYYHNIENVAENRFYQEIKTSPYINFIKAQPIGHDDILMLMCVDKAEVINTLKEKLENLSNLAIRFKVFDDGENDGWQVLQIYHLQATYESMLEKVKEFVEVENIVVLNTDNNESDYSKKHGKNNQVVRELKRNFEKSYFFCEKPKKI